MPKQTVKRKGEQPIIEALKAFDSNIDDVKTLNDGIYFSIKGIDDLVPSNIMGDGLRRFLNIVTAVYERQNSFLLIDEIENGLHHTAYKQLWKSLLYFVERNDVQLFITTHNIETLGSLKSTLEEENFKLMRELCKVFAIAKIAEAEYKSYRYSFEEFRTAIDNDIELR